MKRKEFNHLAEQIPRVTFEDRRFKGHFINNLRVFVWPCWQMGTSDALLWGQMQIGHLGKREDFGFWLILLLVAFWSRLTAAKIVIGWLAISLLNVS